MSCPIVRTQDLPPPGGYKPIPYKRIFAKNLFSGAAAFLAYAGITAGGLYLYYLNYRQIVKNEIEMRSAKMAIFPMLLAERDRAYMLQLRKNRDAEAELMRDVPGWEVGTWYGERVYNQIPKEQFVDPIFHEYYVHSHPWYWFQRAHFKLRT